ncbi:MAG: DUF4397 domain-containing protein [Sphingobacteriales bacterium]|nr:MAG: DUF4397 domain-containing protein [Sphingobacteriales bacterium]
MKKILINSMLCLAVAAFAACEKGDDYKAPFVTANPSKALLKINYASAYALNPSVQLNIDDARVSGLITGRTPFPGGGYNTNGSSFPDYLFLEPGTRKVSVVIPKKGTSTDSIVLFSTQVDLVAGANQSVHISDTLTRTKALLVTDDVSLPARFKIRYRFVNLIPNSNPLDLYYGPVKVATGIPYNTPGAVFEMPTSPTDTFRIREVGSNTVLALYTSASIVSNQRVYTAFAMGYKGATAAATKPYISFYLNR